MIGALLAAMALGYICRHILLCSLASHGVVSVTRLIEWHYIAPSVFLALGHPLLGSIALFACLREISRAAAALVRANNLIDFTEDTGVPLLENTKSIPQGWCCRVCGTGENGSALMECYRCETLHHRDCWDYAGGCAVYACFPRQQEVLRITA